MIQQVFSILAVAAAVMLQGVKKDTTLTLAVPHELKHWLKELAKAEDRSINWLVNHWLEEKRQTLERAKAQRIK